jgi:hypothetical protein
VGPSLRAVRTVMEKCIARGEPFIVVMLAKNGSVYSRRAQTVTIRYSHATKISRFLKLEDGRSDLDCDPRDLRFPRLESMTTIPDGAATATIPPPVDNKDSLLSVLIF